MARSVATTRQRILSEAYRLLYGQGFARVSMDEVGAAAGVTKRTIYNHFESKDALVAAVLDHQQEFALAQIRGWNKDKAASPEQFVRSLFSELGTWASKRGWLGSGFTRLTMELADLPGHPARRAASQHKATVETYLADELSRLGLDDAKMAASQIMQLVEGCMSLMLIHGDTAYADAASQAAVRLVGKT